MTFVAVQEFERQCSAVMARPYPDDSEVASRITILWKAAGYPSSAAFARALGVSPPRVSNVEGGLPLSKDLAFKIVRTIPGMTTDWLWYGIADGLPLQLAQKLGEAQPAPVPGKVRTARS